jgi:beta-N-acetylhexosaminidase
MTPTMRALVPALAAVAIVTGCSTGTPESGTPAPTGAPASATGTLTDSPTASSGASTESALSAPCGVDISDWPLERKIAQTLVVFQPAGDPLPEPWRSTLGGIFLRTPEAALVVGRPSGDSTVRPFIAVDDEGGRVNWDDNHPTTLVAPLDQADQPLDDVRRAAEERGRWLAEQGIDVTFAPVVDLYPGQRGGVIGDRAYSEDPQTVVDYALAFAEGMSAAGIRSTLKHFPGHGRADGDSHLELATTAKLSKLENADLIPYRQLIAEDPSEWIVMMGHLDVPGLTQPGVPASVDPAAYAYLREVIGHDGLIITDEISGMAAVADRYDASEATIAALAAGADLVLLANPGPLGELVDDIEMAIQDGRLSLDRIDAAAARVATAKVCR